MQEFVSDPSRVATGLHVPTEASDCSEFEVKEASGLLGWIRAGKLWKAHKHIARILQGALNVSHCFRLENNSQHFHSMSHVLFLHGPLRVDEVWGASQLLTARDSEDMTSIPADDSDAGDANPFLGLGLMCFG